MDIQGLQLKILKFETSRLKLQNLILNFEFSEYVESLKFEIPTSKFVIQRLKCENQRLKWEILTFKFEIPKF